MTAGTAFCIVCILLVPLSWAGIALINTGLGRSRSAAHMMTASICIVAVSALVYFFCGFGFQGYAGGPARVLTAEGKPWNWLAAQPFFLRGLKLDDSAGSLTAWLQMLTVGLAAMIPLGAAFDRWRLGACCASTALFAGWTYPLFAHWVWGGGWLAQLGVNYGLGRGYIDAGGAGPIHVVGGLTALSLAWILGPRRGKHSIEGMPMAIPGHNAVLVLLGCLVALPGWVGVNAASAMLFSGAEAGRVVMIAINTTLSAAAAALVTAAITRSRFGKPDASLSANGWVGGLVASSAGCAFVAPAAAVLIGIAAGVLVPFCVEWLELYLGVDDPGGAITVHAICGLWSIAAAGFLGRFPDGEVTQWVAQVVGIATLIGFVLPLTYALNWLLNRLFPQRVAAEGERQGMDLYELGAGAYPDFSTHGDDLWSR